MNGPAGEPGAIAAQGSNSLSASCWLKPNRVANPIPGVALTVLSTNGPDAKVVVSVDLAEVPRSNSTDN